MFALFLALPLGVWDCRGMTYRLRRPSGSDGRGLDDRQPR